MFYLPEGIGSVSIYSRFDRVDQEPHGGIATRVSELQTQLEILDPSITNKSEIDFEFVVRPNDFPEALREGARNNLHGSSMRQLNLQVDETIELTYMTMTHALRVHPIGGNLYDKFGKDSFIVPLKYVTGITLNPDRKPLTPTIEWGEGYKAHTIPVTY